MSTLGDITVDLDRKRNMSAGNETCMERTQQCLELTLHIAYNRMIETVFSVHWVMGAQKTASQCV